MMKKIPGKLISGTVLCGCMLFAFYGMSRVSEKADNGAIPVSLTGIGDAKPVIVVEAGHGGIDG